LHGPPGQYFETGGKTGEAPDIAEAVELMKLTPRRKTAMRRREPASC
jgi:hypothetical protein